MKNILLPGILLLFLGSFLPQEGEDWQAKIDPVLLEKTAGGQRAECLVVLKEQADLSQAGRLSKKEEKGRFVFSRLQELSDRSQAPLRRLIEQSGAPYRPFRIINALWVDADRQLIESLARMPEVERIENNPHLPFQAPWQEETNRLNLRGALEWGLLRIGVDQVWAKGIKGQGVVVAGADTGYDVEHPALSAQYRGSDGLRAVDHNYNWHDAIRRPSPLHQDTVNPCGLNLRFPCDDNSHGTHTMGTMVGDDRAGNQIGVAPEARWIACRNMERGYGSPATYIECFEWFLAPTNLDGQRPDPARAPHVVNNSWGCPPMEGCNPSNFSTMDRVVRTLKAAGIVVVASAGNSGSGCSTVRDPAAIFADVFSVGATQPNDTIARFSSRGPVLIDGSGRLKPNVSAPGVSVRSAIPDSSYASFSGTSMAGPHVAGVVALMIAANPALAGQVDRIEQILEETAKPLVARDTCGNLPANAVPNHVYGYGRIDALAAVNRALQLTSLDRVPAGALVRTQPNPAGEEFSMSFEGLAGRYELFLYDLSGRILRNQVIDLQYKNQVERVSLSGLPAGVYLYRIQGAQGALSGKVLKY